MTRHAPPRRPPAAPPRPQAPPPRHLARVGGRRGHGLRRGEEGRAGPDRGGGGQALCPPRGTLGGPGGLSRLDRGGRPLPGNEPDRSRGARGLPRGLAAARRGSCASAAPAVHPRQPHPTGEKDELDRAADASDYTKAHARFHPWFRTFLRERGYYDLFLFDPEGNCIYTVFKELDYATNLITGPWRDTDLGRVFRAARANARPGFLAFADFAPYKPSHGAPAGFIATPVLGPGTRLMGVLALQMPIGRLNAVMRPTAGMGATGDTYIVGADQLMRSQARFAERSSILRTTADTEPVRAALAGRSGVRATTGYRGAPVMSAYAPLDFHGTRWAILADVGLDETLAPVREMRADMLVAVLAVGSAVTLAGFLFARTLTRPLAAMTAAMRRLADGDLAVEVPPAGGDEIGTMARTLVLAREVLAARNQAGSRCASSRRSSSCCRRSRSRPTKRSRSTRQCGSA